MGIAKAELRTVYEDPSSLLEEEEEMKTFKR
jgi:hypothetical protein